MYQSNINILKSKYSYLNLDVLDNVTSVPVSETRDNNLTVSVAKEGREVFLHSKYSPQQEAEKYVNQFDDADFEEFPYIVFYGFGLGYHIEAFIKKFPEKKVIVFEPSLEAFKAFLKHRDLQSYPINRISRINLLFNKEDLILSVSNLLQMVSQKWKLIILPIYDREFKIEVEEFEERIKNNVFNVYSEIYNAGRFEKLWTLNSLKNLKYVLSTPNITLKHNGIFEGKPVCLVAAGPSLQYEFENLRSIKEKGLAYIFSVGSAINALLDQNIYPDAVLTYDPAKYNHRVFNKVVDSKIDTIPMIFGSTVGYKTLIKYTGPTAHFITRQDAINQEILCVNGERPIVVDDAPSISIVALELLKIMGVNPIILVGQNFGFKNNQYYAQGIEYKTRTTELIEEEIKNAIIVKDVHGQDMYSNHNLTIMREQMEWQIEKLGLNVLNTTVGGADIKGAPFVPLSDLMKEKLAPGKITQCWIEKLSRNNSSYDLQQAINKINSINLSFDQLKMQLKRVLSKRHELQNSASINHSKLLIDLIKDFNRAFQKVDENLFHHLLLRPRNRVYYFAIVRRLEEIRNEQNYNKKAQYILESYGNYLDKINDDYKETYEEFKGACEGLTTIPNVGATK